MKFQEPEGRLYEYLDGVLLRGVGRNQRSPRELAVYDLRKLGQWEDALGSKHDSNNFENAEPEDEDTIDSEVRTKKMFNFDISEFAVDPGLDLLVLVEVR